MDNDSNKVGHQLTKKQELNNHIIRMRKSVEQAKVHTIHKLTKEIKRLRERKGDESAVKKSQRKAERLLEEHLKKDAVSIFALQDKIPFADHVQNPESSVETRALGRISNHPVVQQSVKKYRDDNPHWLLQIPVLLEKSKQKQKLAEKKLQKKEKSTTENLPVTKSDDVDVNITNLSNLTSRKKTKPTTDSVTVHKAQGTVQIKVLNDLADLEDEPGQISEKHKPEPGTGKSTIAREDKEQSKRPRSSFFLGGVDEPVTNPKDPAPKPLRRVRTDKNSESKPIFRKGRLINKPKLSDRRHTSTKNIGVGIRRPHSQNLSLAKPATFHSKSEARSCEKLHPSWEAKKQQAPTLALFQGKKKVFRDDD